jgi:hypothetical protein
MQFWIIGCDLERIVLEETNTISNAMICLVFPRYYRFYRIFGGGANSTFLIPNVDL